MINLLYRFVPMLIALFFVLVMVRAPANLLSGQLMQQFPLLSMTGVAGTVWAGRVDTVSVDRNPVGAMQWSFNPSALLFASWGNQIELTNPGQLRLNGDVTLSPFGAVTLSDWMMQARLAWLLERADQPIPGLVVDAQIETLVDNASFSDGHKLQSMQATLKVIGLTIQTQQLGDFAADIGVGDTGQYVIEFSSLSEKGLDVSGTLVIEVDGMARVDMTLARLEALGSYAGLINSLSQPQGQRRQLKWQGHIKTFF